MSKEVKKAFLAGAILSHKSSGLILFDGTYHNPDKVTDFLKKMNELSLMSSHRHHINGNKELEGGHYGALGEAIRAVSDVVGVEYSEGNVGILATYVFNDAEFDKATTLAQYVDVCVVVRENSVDLYKFRGPHNVACKLQIL